MTWLRLSLLACCLSSVVAAAPPEQWQPVDQAVADMDALSTSLRTVHVGLRADGEHTSLFVAPDPDGDGVQRYRVGPGFRARVDRLDYLVRRDRKAVRMNMAPRVDGEFLELAPANTVYELTPLPEPAAAMPNLPDRRVNRQVDGRVGLAPAPGSVHLNGSRPVARPSGRLGDRHQGVVDQAHRAQPTSHQGDHPAR